MLAKSGRARSSNAHPALSRLRRSLRTGIFGGRGATALPISLGFCKASENGVIGNRSRKRSHVYNSHCIKVRKELQYYEQWYEERHNHEPQGEEAKELDRIRAEDYAKMKKSDWL